MAKFAIFPRTACEPFQVLAVRVMLALAASLRLIGAALLSANLALCNAAKLLITLAAVSVTVSVATLLSAPKVRARAALTPVIFKGLAVGAIANFAATALLYCASVRLVTALSSVMRSTKVLLAKLARSLAAALLIVISNPVKPAILVIRPELV